MNEHSMNTMKRNWTFIILVFAMVATVPPAQAATKSDSDAGLYIGAQLGDSIVGALLGLKINKSYSLEVHYDYFDTVYQPNNTVEAYNVGIAGIGMYPVKFGKVPMYIFLKVGYEQKTTTSTTYDPGIPGLFPASTRVSTTEQKHTLVSGGVHYDFDRDVSGRIGVNAAGSDHSFYISAIYKF